MTQCFPFDNESAENLDRCVGSDVLAEYLRFMVGIDHGVYNRYGQSFAVTPAASGYAVKVQPGICFIKGRGRFDDEENTLTLDASEGLTRIDRIVLRLNKPDRWIYLAVIKGTSASNPVAPALVRDDDVYDIGLATVKIEPAYSDILPGNVTDTRLDTEVCGFLPQFGAFDTTGLFDQIQAAYSSYMTLLQEGLDETVAGSLQNQITALALSPAQCAYTSPTFALTAESLPTTVSCTVRFIAAGNYTKGDTLTINGTAYALTMVNGKALPDNAWVSGAVVNLQLDPANKKAFFSAGGADLSFITAAAEHIMQGYIGANIDGEPVHGTRTVQVWTGEASNLTWPADQGYAPIVTFPMPPDFEPDVILFFAFVENSGDSDSNPDRENYYTWLLYGVIDFVYQTGMISDSARGELYTSQELFYSSEYSVKAWSECPISRSAASFQVQRTHGGGYTLSTNIMKNSRIVAFKF